jgi:hypothetical protein
MLPFQIQEIYCWWRVSVGHTPWSHLFSPIPFTASICLLQLPLEEYNESCHSHVKSLFLSLRCSPVLIAARPSPSSSLWQVSICVYPLFGNVRDPAEHPLILLLSSVSLYAWKTREPLDGFLWNSLKGSCNEICRHIPVLVKIERRYGVLCVKNEFPGGVPA